MADQLIDSATGDVTATPIGPVVTQYPFLNNPAPDIYARTHTREFKQLRRTYAPTLAERTTVKNWLTYSELLTNGAWTADTGGAGSAIVVTAGYTGPHGRAAFRLQGDAGSTTSGDYSLLHQAITGLTNPHPALFSVWLRTTPGAAATQNIYLYLSVGFAVTVVVVTATWQRFTLALASHADTTDNVEIGVRGSTGSDQTCDILATAAQFETATTVGAYVPTTSAAREVSAPNIDPDDQFAYLVEESELESALITSVVRYRRTYARIPADQLFPSTKLFDRPSLHNLKSGSTYAVSFDDGNTSTLFSSRKAVASVGASEVTNLNPDNTKPPLPLVQISVVGANSTQTFWTNDSVLTIREAICTAVTGSTTGVNAYYCNRDEYTITAGGGSGSAIKSVYSSSPLVDVTGSLGQEFTVTSALEASTKNRVVNSTSHGGAAGAVAALWNGDKLLGVATVVAATTDTVTLRSDDSVFSDPDIVITHIQFRDAGTTIANGPIRCSAKRTQTYYLPGVSAGITATADIVPPAVVTDPQSWLDTVVAYLASPSNTTYAVHEVSDLVQWRGPIVMQEVLSLQLADAIRQV